MHSQEGLPVQTSPQSRQHVTQFSKLVCIIFIGFLFLIAIITVTLWLSLRPHLPRIHIQDFSISGLAHSKGFGHARVTFILTVHDPNHKVGIYYDVMQVRLYYEGQIIGVADLLVPFYQEPHNTTLLYCELRRATLKVNKQRWKEFRADRARGPVIFRLKMTSTFRFKVFSWNSKHRKMHTSCDFGVGKDGLILASAKDRRCPAYFS